MNFLIREFACGSSPLRNCSFDLFFYYINNYLDLIKPLLEKLNQTHKILYYFRVLRLTLYVLNNFMIYSRGVYRRHLTKKSYNFLAKKGI